ncbi:Subtilisin-like protease [Platanthera zijinensis]|uniref:Subtilisin-like protease n=1 Tax=Platanthera zijinensis TaxID=2320716 RepID=A0AAP0GF81_9ASPA
MAAAAILNILLLILSAHLLVRAQLPPFVDEGGGIDPTKTPVYIVRVRGPPVQARGGDGHHSRSLHFRSLKNWYMSFLPNATLSSGEPRMVYAYREVITGFAARLTADEAEAMEDKEGFVTAYPERAHPASTTYTPTFLGLENNPSSSLWPDSFMGAGQIIGVIDSGIAPTHPSFRDDGMPPPPTKWSGKCFWGNTRTCNNKLLGAVGFRHSLYSNPYDNDGHGTHVASTAAGNFVDNANVINQAPGRASGMAPRAHLAIYKVLFIDASGKLSATDADILAGIEQAIRDKVDILQMSLGRAELELFDSFVAIGSFAAMTKGIVPCAAVANDGPGKSFLANDAPWMLTVGASTIDREITAVVVLGNGSEIAGKSANQHDSLPSSTQFPLIYPGVILNTTASLGCLAGELQKLNLKGKIVMCYRFIINDDERGLNVKNAGGAAMILLNNKYKGQTTFAFEHVLPAAHLRNTGTRVIVRYYKNTTAPTATIQFRGTRFDFNPTPSIASFSSRGPSLTNGGIIKPDVIAPGVNILAAWPRPVGPTGSIFNFLSGTSMATPHVSGVLALLKNRHPTWSPAELQSAIMTTAYTLNRQGNPITDDYVGDAATVFEQGAGHIDPAAAAQPGLVYPLNYFDHVHYLCGLYKTDYKVELIVQGTVNCAQVKGIQAEQLNYPSFGVTLGGGKTAVTVTRRVTNVGDVAGSDYTVNVVEPDGVWVEVTPKTLRFSFVGEELTYDVDFRLKGATAAGEVKDGRLSWDSGKYLVSSPIAVTFV